MAMFSQVSSCAKMNLPLDSCVMTQFLSFVAEREAHNFQLDPDLGKCLPPVFEVDHIQELLMESNDTCKNYGKEMPDNDLKAHAEEIYNLLGNKECWGEFCKSIQFDMNVVGGYEEQLEQSLSEIKNSVVDSLSKCSGTELRKDSCVLSTSLDLLFLADASESGGNHDGYYYGENPAYAPHRVLQGSSFITDAICMLPPIDDTMIMQYVEDAKAMCLGTNQAATDDDVEEVKNAISALVGEKSCVLPVCKDTIEEGKMKVKTMIVDTVSGCTGADLNVDSCVVSASLDMFMAGALDSLGSDGEEEYDEYEAYAYYRQDHESRRALQGSNITDAICMLPPIDDCMIMQYIQRAQAMCLGTNQAATDDDVEEVKNAISVLLGEKSCILPICKDFVNGGKMKVKTTIVDAVSGCTGADLNVDSCVVSTSLDMFLVGALSALTGDSDHNQYDNQMGAEGDNRVHRLLNAVERKGLVATELCEMPPVDIFAINSIVQNAQNFCMNIDGQDSVHADDAERAIAAITSLFSKDSCLSSMCQETLKPQHMYFKTEALEYILECAGVVNVDNESCLQTSFLEEIWKYEGSAEAHTGDEGNHHRRVVRRMTSRRKNRSLGDASTKSPLESTKAPAYYASSKAPSIMASSKAPVRAPSVVASSKAPVHAPSRSPSIMASSKAPNVHASSKAPHAKYSTKLPKGSTKAPSYHSHAPSPFTMPPHSTPRPTPKKELPKICPLHHFDQNTLNDLFHVAEGRCLEESFEGRMRASNLLETLSNAHHCWEKTCTGDFWFSILGEQLKEATENNQEDKDPGNYTKYDEKPSKSNAPTSPPTNIATDTYTMDETKGSIKVTFEAAITLGNLSINEVPTNPSELNAMVTVLTEAISKFLPANTDVRIISVGGVPVGLAIGRSGRRLQEDVDGLEIKFEVIVNSACDTADCDEADVLAESVYQKTRDDFETALTGGQLVTAIKAEAEEEGIEMLASVAVDVRSFKAENMKLSVKEGTPPAEENPSDDKEEEEEESTSSGMKKVFPASLFIVFSVLLVAFD